MRAVEREPFEIIVVRPPISVTQKINRRQIKATVQTSWSSGQIQNFTSYTFVTTRQMFTETVRE